MTNIDHLKIFLSALGFTPEEGKSDIWSKNYAKHNNYRLSIDFNTESIDYGSAVILGDKTTCNFKASENFVVLECVNRLLEKGYSPQSLVLEKDYPLGHKTKGKLDILVNDGDGKGYLMIECKTWGAEYDKAFKKTTEDGGQILSYFQQDKDVQFLSLYTSRLDGKAIEYKNGVLKIEPEFKLAANAAELFSRWNKALKLNGIFEEGVEKYHITPKSYTLNDLDEITREQSSKIFNQFEEILRRNVISDKPNAFNKFIALLICKIVDEKKRKTEQLEFQWLDDDTPEKLLIRLNDLYRAGMKSYLDKTITDYSDKDIDDEFNHLDVAVRGNIKRMFARMRLEKNNEFAFKEVFDNQTFLDNAVVVKELVQMLEKFKVRYNRKHDYLGAFFELLLNTSLKQEAGQFFTPVPIARFIINSIPLREIIIDKIKDRRAEDILPYAIDYACGSGHFITEIMDEIQKIINELAGKDEYDDETERTLNSWKADQFKWAEKHIYGIEKDYRLFKTAKVACFLNGDGLANIINADGLASFKWDSEYKDKLSKVSKTDKRENSEFDVLVSNPPYSVSAFRNTIIDKNGAESFELFDRLTSQSSEIECLFIERTRQLLKEGGYAGIVLPSSILSNSGIYQDTREMLLKYFKIVAIAEFGSNTFMATGTNTVTLFLKRRSNYDYQRIQTCIESFYLQGKDLTCNGVENAFGKYVEYVYKTISFDDYVSLFQQKPTAGLKKHELYNDYRKAFDNSTFVKNLVIKPAFKKLTKTEKEAELNNLFFEEVLKTEREKLLYFILAYP
ncbi:MAG: class I SAM-dependent DNA methyltransferase, partial [Sphingobacteriales bacterium]